MLTRQALVAVRGSHEGPWQLSNGREKKIHVTGLGVGESVVFDSEVSGQLQVSIVLDNGQHDFPSCKSFRFRKNASEVTTNQGETFVSVVI